MSARAPAGNVNSANGRAESVDISEIRKAELPILPNTEKAAVLWAATQIPEITVASHNFLKTGFRNASQIEVLVVAAFMSKEVESDSNGPTPHVVAYASLRRCLLRCLPCRVWLHPLHPIASRGPRACRHHSARCSSCDRAASRGSPVARRPRARPAWAHG